jgi:Tfp pilus assembly protein PilO
VFHGPQTRQLKAIGRAAHITGALIICVGGPLLYYSLSQPLVAQTSAHRSRLETYDRSIAASESIRKEHAKTTGELNELKQRTQAVRQRIPYEPREAEFLGDLSRIADAENIVIQDYRRSKIVHGDKYSQLVVDLEMRGRYENVCSLLDQITKLPRVTSLQRLEIDTKQAADTLPVGITLILYFGLDIAGVGKES